MIEVQLTEPYFDWCPGLGAGVGSGIVRHDRPAVCPLATVTAMTGSPKPKPKQEITRLIDRSSDLKGGLLDFAYLPKFGRWLGPMIEDIADELGVVDEQDAVMQADAFAMSYRFPDGSTLIDKFLATGPGKRLGNDDQRLLEAWSDDGIEDFFEVKEKDLKSDSLLLLSLSDNMEYRVYSNMGLAPLRQVTKGCILVGRIVPLTVPAEDEPVTAPPSDAWLISGSLAVQPKSNAPAIAQAALGIISRRPEGTFRNPDYLKRAWQTQRESRERFIEFFGSDEVVIAAADIDAKMTGYNLYVRNRALDELPATRAGKKKREQLASITGDGESGFALPENLYESKTIGVIYDEEDGISFVIDYAMAQEVFGNPKLLADKMYADLIRGYLRSEDVTPIPLRRLAEAYPETADEVFRRVTGKKTFTWPEHGENLLRKRKPWWYERELLPQVTIFGDRLLELADDA